MGVRARTWLSGGWSVVVSAVVASSLSIQFLLLSAACVPLQPFEGQEGMFHPPQNLPLLDSPVD
eukprot:4207786-Pyramimonas_sp.AAC.1